MVGIDKFTFLGNSDWLDGEKFINILNTDNYEWWILSVNQDSI